MFLVLSLLSMRAVVSGLTRLPKLKLTSFRAILGCPSTYTPFRAILGCPSAYTPFHAILGSQSTHTYFLSYSILYPHTLLSFHTQFSTHLHSFSAIIHSPPTHTSFAILQSPPTSTLVLSYSTMLRPLTLLSCYTPISTHSNSLKSYSTSHPPPLPPPSDNHLLPKMKQFTMPAGGTNTRPGLPNLHRPVSSTSLSMKGGHGADAVGPYEAGAGARARPGFGQSMAQGKSGGYGVPARNRRDDTSPAAASAGQGSPG